MRRLVIGFSLIGLAWLQAGCGGNGSGTASAPPTQPGVSPPGVAAPVAPPGVQPPGVQPPVVQPPGVQPPGVVAPGAPVTLGPAIPAAVRAATIAPFIDDMTVAVMYADLQRIDAQQAMTEFNRRLQIVGEQPNAEADQKAIAEFNKLRQQVLQVYGVVSMNDAPLKPPYAVLKVASGVDPKKVYAYISTDDAEKVIDPKELEANTLIKGDMLVIGAESTIARLKNLTPTPLTTLEQGFTAAGDSAGQIVYCPTDAAKVPLGRLVGELPKELQLDGPTLINSIRHGIVAMDVPPTMQLRLDIQGTDASSAQRLHQVLTQSVEGLRRNPLLPPQVADTVMAFLPTLNGDRMTLALKQEDGSLDRILGPLVPAVAQARRAARDMQDQNNMKQIGLAMHNYANATGKLPAARSVKDGRPMLSWRVHLLPYLEQQQLYAKFKLDEAWDSEHNKALIDQMPSTYRSPLLAGAKGLTTYLVPVGHTTAFLGDAAVGFAEITDGTSNTAMLLEVMPDKAVTWTKPEDWEYNSSNMFQGLAPEFFALVADGSVRKLKTGDSEHFKRFIERNDGQVVNWAGLDARPAGGGFGFGLPTGPGLGAGPVVGPGGNPYPMPTNPNQVGSDPRFDPGRNPGVVPPPGFDPSGRPIQPGNPNQPSVPGQPSIPGQPAVPGESIFITQAKQAFSEGRETDAFNYLYAEALAGEDKNNFRGGLKWVDGLKRPVLAVRWGVAIQYVAPRTYSGGPSPIGRVVMNNTSSPPPGNQPGGDPNAPQPGSPPNTVLDYYTTELGTRLVDGLKTRIEQAQFGEVLQLIVNTPAAAFNPGGFNPAGGAQIGGPNAGRPQAAPKTQPLMPGVMFLGVGKEKELLAKAKEEGLDALILYEIKVEPTRTVVVNTTKLTIYDVTKGTETGGSKVIKTNVVEAARKEKKGVDPVDDAFEKLFASMDTTYKMGDLPANIMPVHIAARVTKLADSAPENRLPVLLEIAFYQTKGLITEEEMSAAFAKLLGPEVSKELVGTPAERQKAIATLLPKASSPTVPGGGKRLGL